LRHLTDKPIEAAWLEPDERIALQARIDHERKSREAIRHYKLREALTNPRILGLSGVQLGIVCGVCGFVYWLPQIIKGMATDIGLYNVTGISINALTGYLVAVPYAFATVAMIWWTRQSDIKNERVWHLVCPFLTGSAAAGGIALINSIGNLGGFVGPYAIGWIKDATGEITLGLVVLGAGPIMAGVVTFLMGHDSKMEMAGSRMIAK
jgi:nitrate/nitrite transporter NarK